MAISTDEVYLLNNKMGSIARKVQLGTLIQQAEAVDPGTFAVDDGEIVVGNAMDVGASVAMSGDATIDNTGVVTIANLAVTNAKVAAAAAIAISKLEAVASARLIVGSAGAVPTAVDVTGDVTISNAGVTAIASGVIVNADVSASAAIAFSKLAALASARLIVGSAGNVATAVDVTGDVTIGNTGVTAIGSAKVIMSMLASTVMAEATGTITQAQLLDMTTPVVLVAAPGAGLLNIVDEIELFQDYAVAAYATGADLQFEYATSGDNIALLADTFVQSSADARALLKPGAYSLDGSTGTGVGVNVTANVNKAIQAVAASAFTNGDATNVLKYRVRYHTVTVIV